MALKQHRFWAWAAVFCMCMVIPVTGTNKQRRKEGQGMMKQYVRLACFVGGALFGSVGLRLLASSDAKRAYTHAAAAGLRMKDAVMETVTTVQEEAADILASARDINEARAAAQAECAVEDSAGGTEDA